VPVAQLDQAAAAVAAAFAQSGYFDVRLVQPVADHSSDGSTAAVSGGGLELVGRSDADSSYFISATLLSGDVAVAVGDRLHDLASLVPPATPSPQPATQPLPDRGGLGPPYTPPAGTHGPKAGAVPHAAKDAVVSPVVVARASSDRIATVWAGWPVLLGLALAVIAGWALLQLPLAARVRRPLAAAVGAVMDRYLRG
jgi:hypothetical protein